MGKRLFVFLRGIARHCTPKMKTVWKEPFQGEPCVFVCNHAGAFGPIDMVAKFPLAEQCLPWFNAQVMSAKEMPAYVRQDYWWKPGCRMEPIYNATLPYIAAAVLPPVMRSVPGIPVYHNNRIMTTMRQSIKALKAGTHLIIFPEQPSGYQSHHSWINTGFLSVATMYYRATGKALSFYPVHIDYRSHVFTVSSPVTFDIERTLDQQVDEIEEHLKKGLKPTEEMDEGTTVVL